MVSFGGILAGAAQGAQQSVDTAAAKQDELDLQKAKLELQDEYNQRVAERTRAQNISDISAIKSAAQLSEADQAMQSMPGGAGTQLSADDLQTLKDNPQAVAAYRAAGATGLLNATPQQEATAMSQAAIEQGRPDLAKDFSDQGAAADKSNLTAAQVAEAQANTKKANADAAKTYHDLNNPDASSSKDPAEIKLMNFYAKNVLGDTSQAGLAKAADWVKGSKSKPLVDVFNEAVAKALSNDPSGMYSTADDVQALRQRIADGIGYKLPDSGSGKKKLVYNPGTGGFD